MPYCRKCGNKIDDNAKFCNKCGTLKIAIVNNLKTCPSCKEQVPGDMFYCLNCGFDFEKKNDFSIFKNKTKREVFKNKWISLILCICFRYLGAHKFYEEKIFSGILYVFTLGLFGIGIVFDIVVILLKPNPYKV